MITPITRRTFMRAGAANFVGVTIANSLTSPLWAEPLVTYPGIQLYTIDKELKADVDGTLKTIHTIGYNEVEGAGFAGLSAKQFRVALDNAGLKCNSTHFFNFGDGNPSVIFDQANTLGVRYVVSSFLGKFGNGTGGRGRSRRIQGDGGVLQPTGHVRKEDWPSACLSQPQY
ncbi:hypothetical protein [Edaphobacter modestus]|uniref:Uncharacterized protein n=1 Tax=Edaphobacter modestus TaxID=388466 RepID=A0A4Q7YR26_9BACT|nr:hypothetical protein [Edaphobacter modestus]RZU39363.1 hypothetical protein BDD14_0739 [Edaphobacter modestus]